MSSSSSTRLATTLDQLHELELSMGMAPPPVQPAAANPEVAAKWPDRPATPPALATTAKPMPAAGRYGPAGNITASEARAFPWRRVEPTLVNMQAPSTPEEAPAAQAPPPVQAARPPPAAVQAPASQAAAAPPAAVQAPPVQRADQRVQPHVQAPADARVGPYPVTKTRSGGLKAAVPPVPPAGPPPAALLPVRPPEQPAVVPPPAAAVPAVVPPPAAAVPARLPVQPVAPPPAAAKPARPPVQPVGPPPAAALLVRPAVQPVGPPPVAAVPHPVVPPPVVKLPEWAQSLVQVPAPVHVPKVVAPPPFWPKVAPPPAKAKAKAKNNRTVRGGRLGSWHTGRIMAAKYGKESHYIYLNPQPKTPAEGLAFVPIMPQP